MAGRAARGAMAYITDAEGNARFFWDCVARSPLLRRGCDTQRGGKARLEFASPAAHDAFVYGGDCFDKGGGDIEVAEALLDFKDRHADRVHLIIGNRDSNKIRLTSELQPQEVVLPSSTALAYWAAKRVTWTEWAEGNGTGRVSKLKWILAHTMGAAEAFEGRRAELAAAGGPRPTDEDVVESFLGSLRPGGFVNRYLRRAALVHRVGNTLFVHGGLTPENIGFVPELGVSLDPPDADRPIPGTRYSDVDEWTARLQEFTEYNLDEWEARPHWECIGGAKTRGGCGLIGYGYSKTMRGHTVMTTSFLNAAGMPHAPAAPVLDFLHRNGIERVVTGHQPYGDSPGLIRLGGVEVVFADTSYSDGGAEDNRGVARAAVTLHPTRTTISGTLSDATEYSFDTDAHDYLGRPVLYAGDASGEVWWCKALLAESERLLIAKPCQTNRFKLTHVKAAPSDLALAAAA
eukprot:TRINITY_DN30328_c0_g1_i1.p1 TRINITY_DN30328_c0_g1~~TRINITY_DN30328_c0_g1_i1.p1  ORF type:complete len:487 (+),score=139.04 TRINITY_DN30328_c0_g1_i1:80-1462(+)